MFVEIFLQESFKASKQTQNNNNNNNSNNNQNNYKPQTKTTKSREESGRQFGDYICMIHRDTGDFWCVLCELYTNLQSPPPRKPNPNQKRPKSGDSVALTFPISLAGFRNKSDYSQRTHEISSRYLSTVEKISETNFQLPAVTELTSMCQA